MPPVIVNEAVFPLTGFKGVLMDLHSLRDFYANALLTDVIPFWERHALDADGGINTCIADDGNVVSRDRWCWSQWRAVWVFSKLYNAIRPEERWLQSAQSICGRVRDAGPLADGHWPLLLEPDGRIKRGYESIFTDTFAIYGLVELWRACREDELLQLAMRTFRAIEATLGSDAVPPIFPYPEPPSADARVHGISMMCSLVYHELADATGDRGVREAALLHHRRVMEKFLRADRGLVVEWLDHAGNEFPPPRGTAVIPGHAIESMWFQMLIARPRGDRETLDRAVEAIRRHLEIGWDTEFGGLFYAVDADGRSEVGWPFADAKLWWPHTEVLVGTLLAYQHCRESWCLDWHERVRAYSWAHYPVAGHGEWRQKLDRRGQPITDVVALPVKDPFHLPRALILSIGILDELLSASA